MGYPPRSVLLGPAARRANPDTDGTTPRATLHPISKDAEPEA